MIAAQVAASSIPDRRAEDDRAAVVIGVAGGKGAAQKIAPRGLSAKLVRFPRRGLVKRITVSGVLTLPRTRPPLRCAGKVQVKALAGKRTVAQTTAKLRTRAKACRYTAVLRPKARKLRGVKRLKVTTRFLGTAQMRARNGKTFTVKVR